MVNRATAINTAKSFVKDCQAAGLQFYKVLLFGSAASDQTHEGSDIDLLLVSDRFGENIFDNIKLYSKINIKYPIIETHPYSKSIFLSNSNFILEILGKENVVIV